MPRGGESSCSALRCNAAPRRSRPPALVGGSIPHPRPGWANKAGRMPTLRPALGGPLAVDGVVLKSCPPATHGESQARCRGEPMLPGIESPTWRGASWWLARVKNTCGAAQGARVLAARQPCPASTLGAQGAGLRVPSRLCPHSLGPLRTLGPPKAARTGIRGAGMCPPEPCAPPWAPPGCSLDATRARWRAQSCR